MRIHAKSLFPLGTALMTLGAAALTLAFSGAISSALVGNSGSASNGTAYPTTQRIIVHGIDFWSRGDRIAERSTPVLDEAAEQLRRQPQTPVFIADRSGEHPTTSEEHRRVRAVAEYLSRQGVTVGPVSFLQLEDGQRDPDAHARAANTAK